MHDFVLCMNINSAYFVLCIVLHYALHKWRSLPSWDLGWGQLWSIDSWRSGCRGRDKTRRPTGKLRPVGQMSGQSSCGVISCCYPGVWYCAALLQNEWDPWSPSSSFAKQVWHLYTSIGHLWCHIRLEEKLNRESLDDAIDRVRLTKLWDELMPSMAVTTKSKIIGKWFCICLFVFDSHLILLSLNRLVNSGST